MKPFDDDNQHEGFDARKYTARKYGVIQLTCKHFLHWWVVIQLTARTSYYKVLIGKERHTY